mgnify:CR=1 FL=1
MKCPYCGSSSIVWDYERGEIICMCCASVVDRIYYDLNTIPSEEFREKAISNSHKAQGYPRLRSITLTYLRFIKKVSKHRGIMVDNKAFLDYLNGKRPHVKILKRKFNEGKLKDELISKVINAMSKYPRLKSRTDRAKLALALIALGIAKGDNMNKVMNKVRKDAKLSTTHVKRLIRLVMRESMFLRDVKEIIVRSN